MMPHAKGGRVARPFKRGGAPKGYDAGGSVPGQNMAAQQLTPAQQQQMQQQMGQQGMGQQLTPAQIAAMHQAQGAMPPSAAGVGQARGGAVGRARGGRTAGEEESEHEDSMEDGHEFTGKQLNYKVGGDKDAAEGRDPEWASTKARGGKAGNSLNKVIKPSVRARGGAVAEGPLEDKAPDDGGVPIEVGAGGGLGRLAKIKEYGDKADKGEDEKRRGGRARR
jgi:hypothetical protein